MVDLSKPAATEGSLRPARAVAVVFRRYGPELVSGLGDMPTICAWEPACDIR